MASQYNVAFKALSGDVLVRNIMTANSPKKAMEKLCESLNHEVTYVNKYSSWAELQRAFISCGGGSCKPCEVSLVGGDRRNFYLVFTQPII